MKFRQRMAWLMLFAYLLITLAVAYYMFEVSSYFGNLANAELIQQHRTSNIVVMPSGISGNHRTALVNDGSRALHLIQRRLAEIPTPFLFFIGSILYMQTFCILYACTRSTFHCHPFLIMVPIFGCIFLFRGIVAQSKPETTQRTKLLLNKERQISDVLSRAVLQYELGAPMVTGHNNIKLDGS